MTLAAPDVNFNRDNTDGLTRNPTYTIVIHI